MLIEKVVCKKKPKLKEFKVCFYFYQWRFQNFDKDEKIGNHFIVFETGNFLLYNLSDKQSILIFEAWILNFSFYFTYFSYFFIKLIYWLYFESKCVFAFTWCAFTWSCLFLGNFPVKVKIGLIALFELLLVLSSTKNVNAKFLCSLTDLTLLRSVKGLFDYCFIDNYLILSVHLFFPSSGKLKTVFLRNFLCSSEVTFFGWMLSLLLQFYSFYSSYSSSSLYRI